ncbi:MAG: hypothetical protein WCQ50_11805 [Spirochaetota bacterium]
MRNENSNKKMIMGLRVLSAGALLGTAALASGTPPPTPVPDSPGYTPFNPASASLIETRSANQRLIDKRLKKAQHADSDSWFQNPSTFGEYWFNDTRDKRQGGFGSSLNSGVIGLNFMTKGDVGIGLQLNYGSSGGNANIAGSSFNNDANNVGLTLSAMKSFGWFFMGLSGGYDYNNSWLTTPVGARLTTRVDGYNLAPFIGAMYAKGNFSASVAPTIVMRWQAFENNTPPNDRASDRTFVLMNQAAYNVTQKLALAMTANWTRVIDNYPTRQPQLYASNNWFTIGPKINYNFTEKFYAYTAYTIDLGSHTYDNQQVTAGAAFNF